MQIKFPKEENRILHIKTTSAGKSVSNSPLPGKKKFTTVLENSVYIHLKELAPGRGKRMQLLTELIEKEYESRKSVKTT